MHITRQKRSIELKFHFWGLSKYQYAVVAFDRLKLIKAAEEFRL